jgi:hypothetical protein
MHGFGRLCGAEHDWRAQYMPHWQDSGHRMVAWHMLPMIAVAWFVFMLGAMMGAKMAMMKKAMMMGGMHGMGPGMGPGGEGMHGMKGRWMKQHHHHGFGMGPCCCPPEPEERETEEVETGR